MIDLVTRLQAAAAAAIANETPALTHPVGRVVGLTIELVIDGAGQVHESVAYVERRTAGGALLARQTGKGAARAGRSLRRGLVDVQVRAGEDLVPDAECGHEDQEDGDDDGGEHERWLLHGCCLSGSARCSAPRMPWGALLARHTGGGSAA